MVRPLRFEYPGAFYHVTGRGNERKRIFRAKSDYEKFKKSLPESLVSVIVFQLDTDINSDTIMIWKKSMN